MQPKGLKALCALLACLALTTTAMAQTRTLLVTTRNGGEVAYALSAKPTVTFTASEVVLTTAEVTVSYPLAEHVQFTFMEDDADGIGQQRALGAMIACKGGRVAISHAAPRSVVSLYSADGRLLQHIQTDGTGCASLPLGVRGTYMVKIGELTMKIAF